MPVRPALLAAALAIFSAGAALAQSPWPSQPAPAAASPWPGAAAPAAAPAASSPFPPAGTTASPFPAPGTTQAPMGQPQQRQQPPAVCNDFLEIRTAAEKGALAIRAATQRKAPPPELCPLFRSYNGTEGKMLKFMTDNKATCGIPDQIITQIKTSYGKTAEITKRVCNPQAAAPGRGKPQTLGDALGTPAIPTGDNTKTGKGGTFDTLSGSNPLAR